MHAADVSSLQRHREYPSVSVLVPTDPGPRPSEVDRARLRHRVEDLLRRLDGDVDPATAVDVVERLRAVAAEVDALPSRRAVALFASPSRSGFLHLDVAVRERTVVDDTFATRDLLEQLRRDAGYLVATVSDRLVRVLEGHGDRLAPLSTPGLPMERREGESDSAWERRSVDALRRAGSPGRPMVLVGAGRRTSALLRAVGVDTVAVVRGNHDATPWSALRDLARPHVDAWDRARDARALERLDAARGRHLWASGLDELWWLARDGRVELLVVERSLAVPVRVVGAHLVPVPPEEAEAPDVVDDAVDDLMEAVVLRRGEVVTVPDGTLAASGGLAAVLRY